MSHEQRLDSMMCARSSVQLNPKQKSIQGFEFTTFAFQSDRVLTSTSDNRNFHVFYYLVKYLEENEHRYRYSFPSLHCAC